MPDDQASILEVWQPVQMVYRNGLPCRVCQMCLAASVTELIPF